MKCSSRRNYEVVTGSGSTMVVLGLNEVQFPKELREDLGGGFNNAWKPQ